MKISLFSLLLIVALSFVILAPSGYAGPCGPRPCIPERPVPPETVGPVSIPIDVPIWPTLLKTEFHILPWINLGKVSICIPGTGRAIEIPAPRLSLKPIPVWIPWLRPLDAQWNDRKASGGH